MLGRQHLILSFLSSVVVASPLLRIDSFYFLLAVAGVSIGSLIPDVDAEDASIFHSNIRGLKGDTGMILNDFLAPILPLFGYLTKYIIYRPVLFVFDKILFQNYTFSDKHRTFTHSLLGVITITSVTGLLIGLPLYFLDYLNYYFLTVFLLAYASGCLLHMLQDSCTRTGIAWNSPFSSKKLKGDIYTGKDFFKIHIFSLILGAMAFISIFVSVTALFGFNIARLLILSSSSLMFAWMIFLIVSGVES